MYLRELIQSDSALITGMVQLELLQGAKSENEAAQLEEKLSVLPMIEADGRIWQETAQLYRFLRKKGISIAIPDLWISSVALEHRLVVLHCDRDFEYIAKHTALKTLPIL